jgi:hypothetical protein
LCQTVARAHLDNVGSHALAVADLVHVALEVHVEELEHEVELGIRVHNVKQPAASVLMSFLSNLCASEAVAHLTTLSSFISLSSEISLMAVEGTPSSSASRRIFLRATISPVSLLRERYCSALDEKAREKSEARLLKEERTRRLASGLLDEE